VAQEEERQLFMAGVQLFVEVLVFGLALWLGLYLLNRNLADTRLQLAGLGLVIYAGVLALDIVAPYAPTPSLTQTLSRWQRPLTFLPAFFWLLLLVQILSADDVPVRIRWRRHPRPMAVILAATVFFALGVGLLLFPLAWLPRFWVWLGIGLDLLLLGLAVAVLDAFDEGEALLPHFFRSLDYSFFTALLFGGQVALVMAFSAGIIFPLLVLLLTTITAAIVIQTFSDTFQAALDNVAFLNLPRLRQTRADLRAAADAASRLDHTYAPDSLDEAEFTRLARRALSHMGNLPRLASSPLTQLPLVEARLAQRGMQDNTLNRAAELKAALTESIARLKPRGKGDFDTSDEWRFYNALYFPYVVGLKPYSRRTRHDGLEPVQQEALDWFRSQVPERTLYNWQNAAAELVAQDLRERSRKVTASTP
jgi:hypothetical protein